MRRKTSLFILFCFAAACTPQNEPLPILGNFKIIAGDTIYPQVDDLVLLDQDSMPFQLSTARNKVFVSDFFFTSCPSICPKVTKQMNRIYRRYLDNDRILLISHTIDPRHDSIAVLNQYAKNLGIKSTKWKLLFAQKEDIFTLANQYFVAVQEDPSAPGGFDHSGKIILLDKNRHVRAFCDGTDSVSVDVFFAKIDMLLADEF